MTGETDGLLPPAPNVKLCWPLALANGSARSMRSLSRDYLLVLLRSDGSRRHDFGNRLNLLSGAGQEVVSAIGTDKPVSLWRRWNRSRDYLPILLLSDGSRRQNIRTRLNLIGDADQGVVMTIGIDTGKLVSLVTRRSQVRIFTRSAALRRRGGSHRN
jgi:hypothetical protein